MHQYFVELSEAAGVAGNFSLLDLPMVFGTAESFGPTEVLFHHMQCTVEGAS